MYQKPQRNTDITSTPLRHADHGPKAVVGPKYDGRSVGHAVPVTKLVPVRVAWKDPDSGRWCGRRVLSAQTTYTVWDGQSWVSQAQFNAKFK